MAQKPKAHKQWLRRFFKGDYYIKRRGNLLLVQKMYISKQKRLLASAALGVMAQLCAGSPEVL